MVKIEVQDEKNSHARYDLVRKMRASICGAGAMAGQAQVRPDIDARRLRHTATGLVVDIFF